MADVEETENVDPANGRGSGGRRQLVRRQSSATLASLAADWNRPTSAANSVVANTIDSYSASLTSARLDDQQAADWTRLVGASRAVRASRHQKYYGVVANEPLLDGFMLLRLMQLLNFDVYYIGLLQSSPSSAAETGICSSSVDKLTANDELINQSAADLEAAKMSGRPPIQAAHMEGGQGAQDSTPAQVVEPSILDEVAELNPLHRVIEGSRFLRAICRYLKICLSLMAILISVDKLLSTILLCLLGKLDSSSHRGSAKAAIGVNFEASDVSMSWIVLVLINLSSTYILFSTVFNGHLLWNLFSQRLFLVSRRFQYKTMLSLLVFVYLEYIINISFVNNLFGWSFVSNDIDNSNANVNFDSSHNIHGGYSVVNNLRKFVTEQDEEHHSIDILLTIIQFARGIIRISPYITIVYAIVCLNEHIKTIRNQYLLTDSLKKRQKLRLVVKNSRANLGGQKMAGRWSPSSPSPINLAYSNSNNNNNNNNNNSSSSNHNGSRKKRVIFVTDASAGSPVAGCSSDFNAAAAAAAASHQQQQATVSGSHFGGPSPLSASPLSEAKYTNMMPDDTITSLASGQVRSSKMGPAARHELARPRARPRRAFYLDRVRDFDELESYITNLYIFTGRLNRLMSRQGLAMFFIVHNLLISCSLIVPEAIRGGQPMVYCIRTLVIGIGIVPFMCGQSLNGQLEQLSKQIDRIIIQQQFTSRRRDNLVRIRELLHDIRVNCGGMLNFNVETGIKYLVVAFASAFFIEQEDYKLTRRH